MKRSILLFLSIFISVFALFGRIVTLDSKILVERQVCSPNTIYVVNGIVDCKGKDIVFPDNCELKIIRGSIRNGTLIGNNTKLKVKAKNAIAVLIKGTWSSPIINDVFFDASLLSDDQIIGNINALQSEEIYNVINISSKDYRCSITELNGALLILRSKTKCNLSSTISLLPCSYTNYQIVQIYDVRDVEFNGGKIIGDMIEHPYTDGSTHEWGHGISIKNARNVKVSSVYISKCIGDGVVVGGWQEPNTNTYKKASKDVVLENIISDDNRRQALTISHADGVIVRKCKFINTGKTKFTAPASGIDIEPFAGNPWNHGIKNVLIEKCFISGNKYRQFLSHDYLCEGDEDNIKNVRIVGCTFEGNCDIHTGGISFIKTTLGSATLRGGKDKIARVDFSDCSFTGANPLIFQGSMFKNEKGTPYGGDYGTIYFKKCDFMARKVDDNLFKSEPTDKGEIDLVILDNCTINCPDTFAFWIKPNGKFAGKVSERKTKIKHLK